MNKYTKGRAAMAAGRWRSSRTLARGRSREGMMYESDAKWDRVHEVAFGTTFVHDWGAWGAREAGRGAWGRRSSGHRPARPPRVCARSLRACRTSADACVCARRCASVVYIA